MKLGSRKVDDPEICSPRYRRRRHHRTQTGHESDQKRSKQEEIHIPKPTMPEGARLKLASSERVALADIAGIVTFPEPADPLLRASVGERIRDYAPLGMALQSIVANSA